jgi:hypothetical protein
MLLGGSRWVDGSGVASDILVGKIKSGAWEKGGKKRRKKEICHAGRV